MFSICPYVRPSIRVFGPLKCDHICRQMLSVGMSPSIFQTPITVFQWTCLKMVNLWTNLWELLLVPGKSIKALYTNGIDQWVNIGNHRDKCLGKSKSMYKGFCGAVVESICCDRK